MEQVITGRVARKVLLLWQARQRKSPALKAPSSRGKGRRFTPHGPRHTFASLHLARGTNLEWIQTQGGWSSAWRPGEESNPRPVA